MVAKKIFINELVEGRQISDCFLVARKSLAETRAGKPYLALTLVDRTGEIEARAWDRAVELDNIAGVGDVIQVQARVTSYQGRLQFGVSGFKRLEPEQVEMADFMPSGKRSTVEMREELGSLIAAVGDAGLKGLLNRLFSGKLLEEFCRAPAAKKMHHAWLGGLLEHSLSVAGMALRTADHYPGLDRDLLLAGALVHDVAKVKEFSYQAPPFEYTDSGRLLGHLVLGAEMVREAAAGIDELSGERLDMLLHLVLSHHGRHDFGAPVLPMTPEAILLHHLDDMDAKMSYIDQLRDKQDEPGWSDFQRPLERFLYLRPLEREAAESGPKTGQVVGERQEATESSGESVAARQQTLF